jgi:iron complex transport system ATP-binding protein
MLEKPTFTASLAVEQLSATYNGHLVLENVSLAVPAGQVTVLIGPNGAGKTTLIRAVSGTLKPKNGKITINGRDITHLAPEKRACLLAVAPQAGYLPGEFSVYQAVMMGRTPYLGWLGYPGPGDHAKTLRALELTESAHLAKRRVDSLSGGERQRVLLARALAQDTPVLLLDEPTTYLDLHHQVTFLQLVRRLARQNDLAILAALHDLNLTSLYADRVALLANGRLQATGDPVQTLTPDNIQQAYSLPVRVIPHPESGLPLVLPETGMR